MLSDRNSLVSFLNATFRNNSGSMQIFKKLECTAYKADCKHLQRRSMWQTKWDIRPMYCWYTLPHIGSCKCKLKLIFNKSTGGWSWKDIVLFSFYSSIKYVFTTKAHLKVYPKLKSVNWSLSQVCHNLCPTLWIRWLTLPLQSQTMINTYQLRM